MAKGMGTLRRRSLLLGLGSLAATQLLPSCVRQGRSPAFQIEFPASAIPATLLKKAQAQFQSPPALKLVPTQQLQDGAIAQQILKTVTGSATVAADLSLPHLSSLSDSWLGEAIRAQLIQPLDRPLTEQLHQFPPSFRELVQRNAQGMPDADGPLWGAPYRWGHLMIAYRSDKIDAVNWLPTDWDSLWDSTMRHRISVPDHERIVLGLVLKSLGQSANTPTLDPVTGLSDRLNSLHQQLKIYSSDSYLQPLLLGDTWAAVGWSTDILPLVRRDRRVSAMVPPSGTLLTADLWVAASSEFTPFTPQKIASAQADPTLAAPPALAEDWIRFFWEPDIAIQLSLLGHAASPLVLSSALASNPDRAVPASLTDDRLLLPPDDIMANSEFLQPLARDAIAQYQQYWRAMRSS